MNKKKSGIVVLILTALSISVAVYDSSRVLGEGEQSVQSIIQQALCKPIAIQ